MFIKFNENSFIKLKEIITLSWLILSFTGCGKGLEPGNLDTDYGNEPLLYPEENTTQFSSIGRMTVDHRLEESHRILFFKDIKHLKNIQLDPTLTASRELSSLLQTTDLYGSTLFQWLEERFQFVLSPTTNITPLKNTYAANFFLGTNQIDYTLFSNATGFPINWVSGQRYPGIIAIYPLLMDTHQKDIRRIEMSRSLIRLATYFHEARHSDGNNMNASFHFPHQQCPVGHEFENTSVCDQFSNGSTAIEYQFLLSALNSCRDCTTVGKNVIKIVLMDYYFRHHPGNGITLPMGDSTPEMVR